MPRAVLLCALAAAGPRWLSVGDECGGHEAPEPAPPSPEPAPTPPPSPQVDCGALASCHQACTRIVPADSPERHACKAKCDVAAGFTDPYEEGTGCCAEMARILCDDCLCEAWYRDSYGFACDTLAWAPAEQATRGKYQLAKQGAGLCGCADTEAWPALTYDECREARDTYVLLLEESGACAADPSMCMLPDLGAPVSHDGTPGCYLDGAGTAADPPRFEFNSRRDGGARPADTMVCRGALDEPQPTPAPTPPPPTPPPAPDSECDEAWECCRRGSMVDCVPGVVEMCGSDGRVCECEAGWLQDPTAERTNCDLCDLDAVCSGRGFCNWDSSRNDFKCSCPPGWYTLPTDASLGQCNWFKPNDFCDQSETPCLPGLDTVGLGYDIVSGAFLSRTVAMTFDQGNKANVGGTSYMSALEVRVTKKDTFDVKEASTTFTSVQEVVDERMRSLGVSASYDSPMISGAIDTEATNTNSFFEAIENEEVVVQTTRELPHYEVRLVTDALDAELKAELDLLPEDFAMSGRVYNRFLNRFGTHYVKSVVMGGYMSAETRMSGCTYAQIEESLLEAAVSAEVGYRTGVKDFGGRAETGMSDRVQETRERMAEFSSLSLNVVGGGLEEKTGLLCKAGYDEWYESTTRHPGLISYQLGDLADLVAGHPRENNVAAAVRERYQRAARAPADYTEVDLTPPGLSDTCEALPDPGGKGEPGGSPSRAAGLAVLGLAWYQ